MRIELILVNLLEHFAEKADQAATSVEALSFNIQMLSDGGRQVISGHGGVTQRAPVKKGCE